MPTLTSSSPIPLTPLFANVTGTPNPGWDPTFDSVLMQSRSPALNYRLRINLRVFLNRINPNNVTDFLIRGLADLFKIPVPKGGTLGGHMDGDDVPTLVRDWSRGEWQNFVAKFTKQANRWNCRFYLIPPDDFSLFDITQGKWKYRPNVRCEFQVQFAASAAAAHNVIEVVNVARPDGTFRSHGQLYSIEDTKPSSYSIPDNSFQVRPHKQYTVTHEIGHAIGLPHIGETKKHLFCSAAAFFDDIDPDAKYIPTFFSGGTNSLACYGNLAPVGDAANIMGSGNKFALENAQPWLDRIPSHLSIGVDMSKWQVSMIRPGPRLLR